MPMIKLLGTLLLKMLPKCLELNIALIIPVSILGTINRGIDHWFTTPSHEMLFTYFSRGVHLTYNSLGDNTWRTGV